MTLDSQSDLEKRQKETFPKEILVTMCYVRYYIRLHPYAHNLFALIHTYYIWQMLVSTNERAYLLQYILFQAQEVKVVGFLIAFFPQDDHLVLLLIGYSSALTESVSMRDMLNNSKQTQEIEGYKHLHNSQIHLDFI